MVAYCSVPKCFSHKSEVRLFSFPKNDEKRMHWAKILGVDSVSKGNKVCAKHFRGKDILKKSRRLKQGLLFIDDLGGTMNVKFNNAFQALLGN